MVWIFISFMKFICRWHTHLRKKNAMTSVLIAHLLQIYLHTMSMGTEYSFLLIYECYFEMLAVPLFGVNSVLC